MDYIVSKVALTDDDDGLMKAIQLVCTTIAERSPPAQPGRAKTLLWSSVTSLPVLAFSAFRNKICACFTTDEMCEFNFPSSHGDCINMHCRALLRR